MLSISCDSQVKSRRNRKKVERIRKTKSFINSYKWEGRNFPPEKDDWKKIEKNNVTIALNVLHMKK